MSRQFAIRFVPPDGGCAVPIEIYSTAMSEISEALKGIRRSMVAALARRENMPKSEIEKWLTIKVLPGERGSNIAPLMFGPGPDDAELPLFNINPADIYMRAANREIKSFSKGDPTRYMTIRIAEHFARAAEIGEKGNVVIQLASRRAGQQQWIPQVDLSKISPGLRSTASKRKELHSTRTQLSGRIENLYLQPLGFKFKMNDSEEGKITVYFHKEHTAQVRKLWGQLALLTVSAKANHEGHLIDPVLVDIKPLVKPQDVFEDYVKSRGEGKDIWDNDEAQEYLDSLRRSN